MFNYVLYYNIEKFGCNAVSAYILYDIEQDMCPQYKSER